MMTKKKNFYLELTTEYVMETYNVTKEEAESILMSNPEMLTPLFGLQVLAYWSSREYRPLM